MSSLFGGAFGAGKKAGSDLFSRSETFRRAGGGGQVIHPVELAPALQRKKKPKVDLKREEEEEERREAELTASVPRAPLPRRMRTGKPHASSSARLLDFESRLRPYFGLLQVKRKEKARRVREQQEAAAALDDSDGKGKRPSRRDQKQKLAAQKRAAVQIEPPQPEEDERAAKKARGRSPEQ